MCSSKISCTVRATMTLWLRLKNDSISCKASDEYDYFCSSERQSAYNSGRGRV